MIAQTRLNVRLYAHLSLFLSILKATQIIYVSVSQTVVRVPQVSLFLSILKATQIIYVSVSQTVVRVPQVVLGFCPCGPFRLKISPKETEKIKLT